MIVSLIVEGPRTISVVSVGMNGNALSRTSSAARRGGAGEFLHLEFRRGISLSRALIVKIELQIIISRHILASSAAAARLADDFPFRAGSGDVSLLKPRVM